MSPLICATRLLFSVIVISSSIETVVSRMASKEYPQIGFDKYSSYMSPNLVALTFDDGPDKLNNTAKCLDILRDKQIKATFFINTENFCNLNKDPEMQEVVRRIVHEGHVLGSHSVSHANLTMLTPREIQYEIDGVERIVQKIIGDNRKITLFRCPYGEPYQKNNPEFPSKEYELVAPIVAERAVHCGWAVDSYDFKCPKGNANCVFYNVRRGFKGGANGAVLLNSVQPQTVAALPSIITWFENQNYKFCTMEDVVRAKYGKSSYDVIYGHRNSYGQDFDMEDDFDGDSIQDFDSE